jgi:hypothetical protein
MRSCAKLNLVCAGKRRKRSSVFGSGTVWPDVIVASIMASLSLSGGFQILRHAIAELRGDEQLPSQTSGTVS